MDRRRTRGKQIGEFRTNEKTVLSERPSNVGALMAVLSRVSGIPGNKHLRAVDPHGIVY